MSVISLAIVGKNNTPIYLREFDHVDAIDEAESLFGLSPSTTLSIKQACSVRQQFILHAALDKFEQLAGPPPACAWRAPGVTGTDAMFVGFLCPVDDMRVYGYMTTTQIKFLLTVRDGYHEDIQKLFAKIHAIYVGHILNPFSPLNAPISSNRFDQQIQQTDTEFCVGQPILEEEFNLRLMCGSPINYCRGQIEKTLIVKMLHSSKGYSRKRNKLRDKLREGNLGRKVCLTHNVGREDL